LEGGSGKYAKSILGYLEPGLLNKGASASKVSFNANTAEMWTVYTVDILISSELSLS